MPCSSHLQEKHNKQTYVGFLGLFFGNLCYEDFWTVQKLDFWDGECASEMSALGCGSANGNDFFGTAHWLLQLCIQWLGH